MKVEKGDSETIVRQTGQIPQSTKKSTNEFIAHTPIRSQSQQNNIHTNPPSTKKKRQKPPSALPPRTIFNHPSRSTSFHRKCTERKRIGQQPLCKTKAWKQSTVQIPRRSTSAPNGRKLKSQPKEEQNKPREKKGLGIKRARVSTFQGEEEDDKKRANKVSDVSRPRPSALLHEAARSNLKLVMVRKRVFVIR